MKQLVFDKRGSDVHCGEDRVRTSTLKVGGLSVIQIRDGLDPVTVVLQSHYAGRLIG